MDIDEDEVDLTFLDAREAGKATAERHMPQLGYMLSCHPMTNNYRSAMSTLMFLVGREFEHQGRSDDEGNEYIKGVCDAISALPML